MRTVRYTSRFKRDYRHEKSRRHGKQLDIELLKAVTLWHRMSRRRGVIATTRSRANGVTTATVISGPDLILIYRKADESSPDLVRLGSYSELEL